MATGAFHLIFAPTIKLYLRPMLSSGKPLDFIVLIPHYNDPRGLVEAVASIVYTHDRFGILIVDDGSVVPLNEWQVRTAARTTHIEIIKLPLNKGITAALNAGLEYIYTNGNYIYIARLDCGDQCHPERFYEQVAYLDKHPEIMLAGSWCYFINTSTKERFLYQTPVKMKGIRLGMNFRNLFIHPTMMWRKEAAAIIRWYPETYPSAEDYAFAYSLMERSAATIIPKALVTCQLNPNGISYQKRRQQLQSRSLVVKTISRQPLPKLLGRFKLWLMQMIPFNWILRIKFLIHRKQHSIQI
ncbi:glycosyltransferase [Flavihumibacter rivuli]|uniref:glycosyltransferase n=1 Tax=Flavihumibacter rivuli TaxID=2838156 RepID=UPI001BDE14AE|nr:glycosyltransferase [Flavihumibacter rivuli]ULQ56473.1 glycosyltransferase [Flavihumibacter rivuli]